MANSSFEKFLKEFRSRKRPFDKEKPPEKVFDREEYMEDPTRAAKKPTSYEEVIKRRTKKRR